MDKLFARLFPAPEIPDPPAAGVYQRMLENGSEQPDRLHLRIEPSGEGVLIVNASIVLHLNQTAAEHVYWWIQGKEPRDTAAILAARYRVSSSKALNDNEILREQVLALSSTPDLDPVIFLDMDRTTPYDAELSAPYRLDCALTYKIDEQGTYDPDARARVDRELSVSEWKQVLAKAWAAGIPHVTFTGGEPTLYDGLIELIDHAETLGQITGLLTNGIRLTDPQYLHTLVMTGLDHLLVAVQVDDPRSTDGLKAALDTDIYTAAHLTITSANQKMVNEQIKMLKTLGVGAISLSAGDEEAADESVLSEAGDFAAHVGLDLIWDLPAPYSRNNPIDLELEGPSRGPGRAWLYVEPDGDVLPGQGINEILGNLLQDEWGQIWRHALERN